jgi:replicative DNA helicase
LANNGTVNRFTLIATLESLNIKIGGALEPAQYINSLVDLNGVNDRAAIDIASQLKRWTVRRELHLIGREIVERTKGDDGTPATELVADVMGTFHNKVNLLGGVDDEPKDLYASIEGFLAQENSYSARSLKTPFPIYNDMYGYLDPQNVYVIVARMKVGKSTFGLSMLQQIADGLAKDKGFRALILDTEMSLERAMARAVASFTGIREHYILQKTYKRHPEMVKKVEAAMEFIKPLYACVDHVFVGGKSLEDQQAIARRWAYKHMRDGRKGAIMVDYLKLNSASDFDSDKSLSLNIGKKIDAFKNLSIELNLPIIVFCQANRENEDSKTGGKMQNTNVIAGSDMIAQFATNIYLLEKLTLDQKVWLNLLDPNQATHSLTVLAPRQLGPNETGLDCMVKFKDKLGKDRYLDNFLLFSFHNFKVTEYGTFKEAVERANVIQNVQHPQPVPAGQHVI